MSLKTFGNKLIVDHSIQSLVGFMSLTRERLDFFVGGNGERLIPIEVGISMGVGNDPGGAATMD